MKRALGRAGIREHSFDTGEVVLNYATGPDNGPPLLLIPGQTMPWESYQRVLPELSRRFTVHAVDPRGHGRSGWTPGAYTWDAMGRDFTRFLEQVAGEPAVVSGNSSGGIIAVWLAARVPHLVRAVVAEDPPLFSCEWPRLRDDCFVHRAFQLCVEAMGDGRNRDLGAFLSRLEIPVEGKQTPMRLPRALGALVAGYARLYQRLRPGRPVDLRLMPPSLRVFVKGLSQWDPDFTRAFLDGSACAGFSHEEALSQVSCPMMLLHANWFRHEEYGLVGAMDDDDVARVRGLVRDLRYLRIDSGHTIHLESPRKFIDPLVDFVNAIE